MHSDTHSTWVEVDLGAIRNNISQVSAISQRPVMAIVKANAYGHGLVEVARTAVKAGVPYLGVARIDEALILRQQGLTVPVLVLGSVPPECIPDAIQQQITVSVFSHESALAYMGASRGIGLRLKVHAKVDTGMGRLGVFPEEAVRFVRFLKEQSELDLEGLFTHFAFADEPGMSVTSHQVKAFQKVVDDLDTAGLRPRLVHAANSAAALYTPEARFDMVRSGIAIYGLHPSAHASLPPTFRPALTWKARLSSVKILPGGSGIGYSYRYVTRNPERIGTAAIGYADGMRRRVGNFALVDGKRVPLAGGVCMDQIMLRLDAVPDAKAGDEVVLIGRQGNASITAEDWGREWDTVNYEVVCGLSARVSRIYFNA